MKAAFIISMQKRPMAILWHKDQRTALVDNLFERFTSIFFEMPVHFTNELRTIWQAQLRAHRVKYLFQLIGRIAVGYVIGLQKPKTFGDLADDPKLAFASQIREQMLILKKVEERINSAKAIFMALLQYSLTLQRSDPTNRSNR